MQSLDGFIPNIELLLVVARLTCFLMLTRSKLSLPIGMARVVVNEPLRVQCLFGFRWFVVVIALSEIMDELAKPVIVGLTHGMLSC